MPSDPLRCPDATDGPVGSWGRRCLPFAGHAHPGVGRCAYHLGDRKDWVYAAWTQDKEAAVWSRRGVFAELDEADDFPVEHQGGSWIASVSRWQPPFVGATATHPLPAGIDTA